MMGGDGKVIFGGLLVPRLSSKNLLRSKCVGVRGQVFERTKHMPRDLVVIGKPMYLIEPGRGFTPLPLELDSLGASCGYKCGHGTASFRGPLGHCIQGMRALYTIRGLMGTVEV